MAVVNAVQADWSNPARGAAETVLGTALPLGASRLVAQPLARAAAPLASPVLRRGAAATGEALAGAGANALQSVGTQAVFDGKIDPQQLVESAIVGGVMSGADMFLRGSGLADQARSSTPGR